MKKLTDLPKDIDKLFFEKKGVNEEHLKTFLLNLGDLLRDRLTEKVDKADAIRMSKLGIPNLRLWYDHNFPEPKGLSSNALKFIYGDIVEQLVLYLAKEAGHTIEEEQQECEIEGIKGHKDAKIDGVTCDIKSASRYGFKKFAEASILRGEDPFGYVAQLSAYMFADRNPEGAFLAVNKESGEMCVLPLTKMDTIDPVQRIKEIKEVLASKEPPSDKCYAPEPEGTSGNLIVSKNCSDWCPHFKKCWAGQVRAFNYSNGVKYLTKVVKEPRVEEIPLSGDDPINLGKDPE